MKLYTIKTFLLDLVFPRFCLGCKKELMVKDISFICSDCFEKIILNSGVRCHICGSRNGKGVCRRCRKKTPLKGLFAACGYHDLIVKEMIHKFKYQSIESLKKPLVKIINDYLKKENLIKKLNGAVLAPIPLTLRRKINRGFNQSELLAKEISKFLNLPTVNLLQRKGFTKPQAEISDWQKRKENISGAFCIKTPPNLPLSGEEYYSLPDKGGLGWVSPSNPPLSPLIRGDFMGWVGNQYKKVVLIDDVSTSGATLEEAARILKQAGVKEVYGLVVAKG